MSNRINTHIKLNIYNYCFLFIAILLIGYFSPTGPIKAFFTLFFLYIFSFGLNIISDLAKPLNDFFTKAGNVTLFNSKPIGIIYIIWGFGILFSLNYTIRRYSGILFLDPFIIIFWGLLYCSIHIINYVILKKSQCGGRELTEVAHLLYNKNKKITNESTYTLNILASATVVSILLLLRGYPYPVTYGENILSKIEDYLFSFVPYFKMERYETIL